MPLPDHHESNVLIQMLSLESVLRESHYFPVIYFMGRLHWMANKLCMPSDAATMAAHFWVSECEER